MTIDKPKMRQRTIHWGTHSGKVWVATYKGYKAQAVCPVWAYCEVKERARKGY